MKPLIRSGQQVRVEPVGSEPLRVGDVVLCRLNGGHYLHLIKAVQGDRYLVGNNRGRLNGWASRRAIFGRWIKS